MRLVPIFSLLAYSLLAGTPPTGFSEVVVASGLSSPTAFAFAPDGRIFICQQTGAVRVVKNGTLLSTPFTTFTVDSVGERGLLGIAFDPNFAVNNYVYFYYTVNATPRFNLVVRLTANGDVALANSEVVLLQLNNLTSATNHNGGALHFGPDGKLYIAVGENATTSNSQTLSNLLGKILRMNSDGTIPTDNPFFGTATGQNRLIWALGLRNPFTFAFDQQSSRMFINDVGQNTWEEVNDGIAGANYGWPNSEGPTSNVNFRTPYYYYGHSGTTPSGCAITGGAFYNPTNPTYPPAFINKYFFADYCSGWIYYLNPALGAPSNANSTAIQTPTLFLTDGGGIVDIRTGPDGKLYYLQRSPGSLRRIDNTNSNQPSIITQPGNTQVSVGQTATFTVSATGPSLSYQWRRNNTDIPGATSATYSLSNAQLSDSGAVFRVFIQNSSGSVLSDPAGLTVVSAQPPTATILTPAVGTLFSGGDTIFFTGSGTDQNGNSISANTFQWKVDYITGSATRPFVQPFTGATGSFTVPQVTPYLLTDVYFLISLTVTDSQNLSTTVTRRVNPRTSQVTLNTTPVNLSLTLDGQPVTAPLSFDSVVGLIRPIGAPSPQTNGGTRYVLNNWSDGGAQTHDITVSAVNTTYTANFSTQHLLTTQAGAGGTVTAGGWFNAGSVVPITATPNPGFTFAGFTGDLTGTTNPQSVTMSAPRTVNATFAPSAPPMLVLQLVSKADSGTPGVRAWTLRLSNTATGAAVNARISNVQIEVISGAGPVSVASSLPLAFGNIAPGTNANATLLLNFPATTPPTRTAVTYTVEADGGYVNVIRFNSQFR
jgi:glucose/arabinose dehydrogenase